MYTDVRLPKRINKYEKDVKRYEDMGIVAGLIMFYGDSGFTRWSERYGNRELEEDIRMKDGSRAAVNHGLGGSTSEELLYFYPRMVRAWQPRALVFRSYGNDSDLSYTPEEIMFLQSRIFEYARHDMPGIKIFAIDAHPTVKGVNPTGVEFHHRKEYNERLRDYCAKHDDCTFVCHTESPLFFNDPSDMGDYSKIRTDIYIEDQVHHNQEGYDLYGQFVRDFLGDLL